MNKFLNRKKPDAVINTSSSTTIPSSAITTPLVTDLTRSITPSQISPGLKKSQSKWKKTKKAPEPKLEINLNNVLPSADDFRTSLILPKLSARFSMLREQDDPNSLLGKAMDDSVLQPRRRSRMVDFGGFSSRGGLGDIAEVSSIRSSIRPPFAGHTHGDSFIFDDGYDSDPNSSGVMSRSRPGEGNVMFGGRQKVYMIPKSASSRSLGKAVYEDDIRTSAFQKHRQREREAAAARMAEEARHFDFGLPQEDIEELQMTADDNSQTDLAHSPSLSSYDKKRHTNSSTARSEARSSTAATSVASQPLVSAAGSPAAVPSAGTMQSRPSLERSNTKARRLYEPGLDQHIHEQQNSAMTRLNSIHRQRSLAGAAARAASPYLHQVKSAGNLQDQSLQRSVYAVGTQSPPLDRQAPPPLASVGSSYISRNSHDSPTTSNPASPLSPQLPNFDEPTVLSQAIEPADRGKATAMGAFNKPKQPFDEQQYLERQMQLQRSASSATIKVDAVQSTFQQRIGRFEDSSRKNSTDRARSRSKSKGRDVNTNNSNSQPYQGSVPRNPNRSVTPSQLAQYPPQMSLQYSDAHRTFFGNIAASDSEDEEEEDKARKDSFAGQADHLAHGRWQPTPLPSVSEHPAFRNQKSNAPLVEEEEEEMARPRANEVTVQALHMHADPQVDNSTAFQKPAAFKFDSPMLSENLSGMISHLRSRSNASSMFPGDEVPYSADIPELPANARNLHAYGANNPHLRRALESDVRVESTHSGSNPWDLEDASTSHDLDQSYNSTYRAVSPLEPQSAIFGSRVPNHTAAHRDHQGQSQVSQVSGISSQDSETNSWQSELRKQNHQRDASSATQQAREAFDNELAARRAAIQDNIKSIVETERSNSPQTSSGPFKALGMLRTKSSRDSFERKRDTSKSLKSFVSGASSTAPSPTTGPDGRGGFSFDLTRPRGDSGSRPPMPLNAPRVRALHSEQEVAKREWTDGKTTTTTATGRSPSSSDAGQDARSRSNSVATTGRSRSRTGPYRDDLEKAMVEGTGTSAAGLADFTQFMPKELTPRPSPDIMSIGHFDSAATTSRTASKAGATNYFDAKAYQPVQSPRIPSNAPAVTSARSSPAVSPFVQQTATPPISGASTPLNASFTSASSAGTSSRPLRKKTISKSDISEPTLLSWTSNIDTVDLPPGASLKNGMVEAPPVPPINPRRKTRKIFGKSERVDSAEEHFEQRHAHAKTSDPWVTFDNVLSTPARGYENSPATNQYGFSSSAIGSPDRAERQASGGARLNGAMF